MDIQNIEQVVLTFFLIFVRVSSFLFLLPMLNNKYIPNMTKVVLAAGVSLGAYHQVPLITTTDTLSYVGMLGFQLIIGLTLGYVVEVIFATPKIAGSLIDMDMGFSAAQLLDPGSNQHTTIISNMLYLLFVYIYVAVGGLQSLLSTIVYSFQFLEPTLFFGDADFLEWIKTILLYMFTASIQIALPITASMFIINLVMLIIGKSAPQVNIFANIFTIKIAIGMILLFVALPFIGDVFVQMNEMLMEKVMETMNYMFQRK